MAANKPDYFAEVQTLLDQFPERTHDDDVALWGYIFALHEAKLITIDQWETLNNRLGLEIKDVTNLVLWKI